jgi:phosphatidylglycerol:prolipoprotein diacylglycerol transferase
MYPTILHIYGPFELNSYGLTIAISVGLFLYLTVNHPTRQKYVSQEEYINSVVMAGFVGVAGGRFLHILSEWHTYATIGQMLSVWNGGLSVLGTIISILAYATYKLNRNNIPLLPMLDLVTLYAPLVHAISRIGCFLTGCCYGCPTDKFWGITYTNPDVIAPLYSKIHPTQLYSSAIFFVIFICLYRMTSKKNSKPGYVTAAYIMLQSTERLLVDFFRGDRILAHTHSWLSFHQWLALGMFIAALFGFVFISFVTYKRKSQESNEPV